MNFSELNIFYKSSLREKYDPNKTGLHRDLEIFLEQKFEKFKDFHKLFKKKFRYRSPVQLKK